MLLSCDRIRVSLDSGKSGFVSGFEWVLFVPWGECRGNSIVALVVKGFWKGIRAER